MNTALLKVREAALNNKLGASDTYSSCLYKKGDRNCAIGYLLPKKDLKWIIDNKFNTNTAVDFIAGKLGVKYLEEAVGLPMSVMSELQDLHDTNFKILKSNDTEAIAKSEFIKQLDLMIKNA